MDIGKKVAYLKGLAEGLEISADSKTGKIITGILDVLEEMAESIELLEDESDTLDDYITEVDEDLGQLEEDFDKTCGHKLFRHEHKHKNECERFNELDEFNELDDLEDYEDDLEDDELLDGIVEIKCPKCNKHIFIETDDLLDSDYINCSECGGEIKVINEMRNGAGCSCEHCAQHDGDDIDEDEEDIGF